MNDLVNGCFIAKQRYPNCLAIFFRFGCDILLLMNKISHGVVGLGLFSNEKVSLSRDFFI